MRLEAIPSGPLSTMSSVSAVKENEAIHLSLLNMFFNFCSAASLFEDHLKCFPLKSQ